MQLSKLAFALTLVLAGTATAAAQDDPPSSPHTPHPWQTADGSWQRPAHGCGTSAARMRITTPDESVAWTPYAAGQTRTIYLNRFGGTYTITTGGTDAATNMANRSVAANGSVSSVVIPPLESGFTWDTISSCVRNHFRAFNVRIVEEEPTSGDYIEAVVGGYGTELGYGSGELFGIAAADNFCNVTERGIAFSFSRTHQGVPQSNAELCATIAHEVGHLIALEHETLAEDLMSYVLVDDATSKAFVDQDSSCGTYPGQGFSCSCSVSTTNSFARLEDALGLFVQEDVPPTIAFTFLGDGDQVPADLFVQARATDAGGMDRVDFYVDDVLVGTNASPAGNAYGLTVALAGTDHVIAAEATDLSGNSTRVEVNVRVSNTECADDYELVEGACRLRAGRGCDDGAQCAGGICADRVDGNGGFCSESCSVTDDQCPQGLDCGDAGQCILNGEPLDGDGGDGGGCCSTGGSTGGMTGMGLLIVGVGIVLGRRRRPSSQR